MAARDDDEGPTLDEAKAHYAEYLGSTALAAHAASILDMVIDSDCEEFGIAQAIAATGGADLKEVLPTLMHLSQGRNPPLVMDVVFTDANGSRHVVKADVNAISNGAPFHHPVTGDVVDDPATKMHLNFRPVASLMRGGPGHAP